MSKRIITTMLLLFLIFNLSSCFDTDDLFDNVIAPEGSVPDNTEKATVIEPTEEPTEETEQALPPLDTEEDTSPEIPIGTPINKTTTLMANVVSEDMYDESLDNIRDILTKEDIPGCAKLKSSGGVKNAYECVGAFSGLDNFGSRVSLGKYMLLSVCENVYVIDGNEIGDEYANSEFLVIKYYGTTIGFMGASTEKFEKGVLTLNIEYSAVLGGDDGILAYSSVIEIDKSFLEEEKITTIELLFNAELLFTYIPEY